MLELMVFEINGPASDALNIDITNDSVDDFYFSMSYWYSFVSPSHNEGFSSIVNPLNMHTIGFENDYCGVKALNYGDTIWSNINWTSFTSLPNYSMFYDPEFGLMCSPFSSFQYCPVKLNINNNIHYGWLKMKSGYHLNGYEPGSYAYLYISEFAYNLEPNRGIIAGDTITSLYTTSINNLNSDERINIYPNPVSDILTLKNVGNYSKITIRDIVGKIVYHCDKLVDIKQIDCQNFNNGLYYITISNNKKVVTHKIIIAKNK